MRHRIAGKKLNRAVKPRRALFRSLVASLVNHGSIETSLAKAKAIRPLVDKLVTRAKKPGLTAHRQVQAFIQNQELVQKLVRDLAPNFKRNSGFTKITRLPIKRSDSSLMVRIEWSEKNDKLKVTKSVLSLLKDSKLPKPQKPSPAEKKTEKTGVKKQSKNRKSTKIGKIKKK